MADGMQGDAAGGSEGLYLGFGHLSQDAAQLVVTRIACTLAGCSWRRCFRAPHRATWAGAACRTCPAGQAPARFWRLRSAVAATPPPAAARQGAVPVHKAPQCWPALFCSDTLLGCKGDIHQCIQRRCRHHCIHAPDEDLHGWCACAAACILSCGTACASCLRLPGGLRDDTRRKPLVVSFCRRGGRSPRRLPRPRRGASRPRWQRSCRRARALRLGSARSSSRLRRPLQRQNGPTPSTSQPCGQNSGRPGAQPLLITWQVVHIFTDLSGSVGKQQVPSVLRGSCQGSQWTL